MKAIAFLFASLHVVISVAQVSKPGSSKLAPTKPSAIIAPKVSREKAWEYLMLTRRTDAMEKLYRSRFVDVKGAKPVGEAMKKKHLAALNEMLIKLVQNSFSATSLDAVITFLKTPGGERWSEDANTFNEEFRDESSELLSEFAEEIKEANDEAAESAR